MQALKGLTGGQHSVATTNSLKSIFISAYITLLGVGLIHSLIGVAALGLNSAWTGALLSLLPMVLFFCLLFVRPQARTSAELAGYRAATLAGVLVTLTLGWGKAAGPWPLTYSLIVGAIGMRLYIGWYSRLDRRRPGPLQVGALLPELTLFDLKGQPVSTLSLRGRPALLVFYRGNWCPLCVAQIKEVAAQYRELADLGAQICFISPQSQEQTAKLAARFDVPLLFWCDRNNQAARFLQIDAPHGIPKGLEVAGYDSETVMPTVVLTDAQGRMILVDQTDNYRVRPQPDTFIDALRTNQASKGA